MKTTTITISDNIDFNGAYAEIYDVSGRKVKMMTVIKATFLLAKEDFPAGIYTIKLICKEHQITKRFVIQ